VAEPRNHDEAALAKILIIEKDPVFAALLEDELHAAGHQLRFLAEGSRTVAAAIEAQADLVILNVPTAAGLDVVRKLRAEPLTRSSPILVLSDRDQAADRVAALRAGADDYLPRPCDPEELKLRIRRLLGNRTGDFQILQGDLATFPLWAVLQYLRQVGKGGRLRLRSNQGNGSIFLRSGEMISARWQGTLAGTEALLALLAIEEGRFRLDLEIDDDAPELAEPPQDLRLHETLLRAAWLKEEIASRRQNLPATGEGLRPGSRTAQFDPQFGQLPLERILERVREKPGLRVFDLLSDRKESPLTVRLAVAYLVENGALVRESAGEGGIPTTMDLSGSFLLEVAVADLMETTRARGFTGYTLSFLVLVEEGTWPALRHAIEVTPGFRQNDPLRRLLDQVELGLSGMATFTTESEVGKLALYVQRLTPAAQLQMDAIVQSCAGVLAWIEGAGATETLWSVIDRLETSRLPAVGTVIAPGEEAQREAERLLRGHGRWRISQHAPQSLLGLFRLFHPQDSV
jgi:DNA-binding response OmpR family regulator